MELFDQNLTESLKMVLTGKGGTDNLQRNCKINLFSDKFIENNP
jgi:hypothetical protein